MWCYDYKNYKRRQCSMKKASENSCKSEWDRYGINNWNNCQFEGVDKVCYNDAGNAWRKCLIMDSNYWFCLNYKMKRNRPNQERTKTKDLLYKAFLNSPNQSYDVSDVGVKKKDSNDDNQGKGASSSQAVNFETQEMWMAE